MKRRDLILASVTPGSATTYTPVQKLLFLIDKQIPDDVEGPHFSFTPYHYGPFDRSIYDDLDALESAGAVEVERDPEFRIRKFRLKQTGVERGAKSLAEISAPAKQFIERANAFVRNATFPQLVSAIYRDYPEMKVNSIFRQ